MGFRLFLRGCLLSPVFTSSEGHITPPGLSQPGLCLYIFPFTILNTNPLVCVSNSDWTGATAGLLRGLESRRVFVRVATGGPIGAEVRKAGSTAQHSKT